MHLTFKEIDRFASINSYSLIGSFIDLEHASHWRQIAITSPALLESYLYAWECHSIAL